MYWIREDQAFSPSYDLAPFPYPPPPLQQVVSLSQPFCVSPVTGEEGEGAKSDDGENAWFSIIHLLLSVAGHCAAW